VACIDFLATFARERSGSDESCSDYGVQTNLELCTPIAAGMYCISARVVDLNGALAGDNVRLRIRRYWGDASNTSTDPASVIKVAIEYDVQ